MVVGTGRRGVSGAGVAAGGGGGGDGGGAAMAEAVVATLGPVRWRTG